jgi:hypothetical protein
VPCAGVCDEGGGGGRDVGALYGLPAYTVGDWLDVSGVSVGATGVGTGDGMYDDDDVNGCPPITVTAGCPPAPGVWAGGTAPYTLLLGWCDVGCDVGGGA